MLALIAAWIFGASGFVDGCNTLVFYRSDAFDPADLAQGIKSEQAHAQVVEVAQHYVQAMNDARGRAFPLAVAAMLLGAVMVAFAARAMAGRQAARTGLMQVVTVQAALVVAAFFLTPDVRHAQVDLRSVAFAAQVRESGQDPHMVEQMIPFYTRLFAYQPPVWLAFRSTMSLLVLVALTRARSRAFFDAAEARWSGSQR